MLMFACIDGTKIVLFMANPNSSLSKAPWGHSSDNPHNKALGTMTGPRRCAVQAG